MSATAFKFKKKYTQIPNVSFTGSSLAKSVRYLEGIEIMLDQVDVYYERSLSILNTFRNTGRMSSSQLTLLGCYLADAGIDIMADLIFPIMNQREPVYRFKANGGWLKDPVLFSIKPGQKLVSENPGVVSIVSQEPKQVPTLENRSTPELLRMVARITNEIARRMEDELNDNK